MGGYITKIPVSITVLFYHRSPDKMPDNFDPYMLHDCLDSIIRNTKDYELICVDNGSTMDMDWVKEYCDKYIRFDKNMGISNGWNIGLYESKYDHRIILGDDTVVSPGWDEAMLECFEKENCGMSCPHVQGMPYGEGIKETHQWFPGACFMLHKDTIDKVGYFDWKTYFPCNYEDIDYQARVLAHGMKLYTNYKATVQHRMGATLHVDDLSEPFDEMGRRFEKKHGFNGQDYFYRGKDIRTVLEKVNKNKVLINLESLKMI